MELPAGPRKKARQVAWPLVNLGEASAERAHGSPMRVGSSKICAGYGGEKNSVGVMAGEPNRWRAGRGEGYMAALPGQIISSRLARAQP